MQIIFKSVVLSYYNDKSERIFCVIGQIKAILATNESNESRDGN